MQPHGCSMSSHLLELSLSIKPWWPHMVSVLVHPSWLYHSETFTNFCSCIIIITFFFLPIALENQSRGESCISCQFLSFIFLKWNILLLHFLLMIWFFKVNFMIWFIFSHFLVFLLYCCVEKGKYMELYTHFNTSYCCVEITIVLL